MNPSFEYSEESSRLKDIEVADYIEEDTSGKFSTETMTDLYLQIG